MCRGQGHSLLTPSLWYEGPPEARISPNKCPQMYLLIPGSLLNSLITVAMTTRLSSEPKMEGVWLMSKAGVRDGTEPHPKPGSHLFLYPLDRADPGGLSSICPQPPAGPWGPLKPPGRSQVMTSWGQSVG